jgi:hypothetical protein
MEFDAMERPYARKPRRACAKLPYFAVGALPCCGPALHAPRPATLPRVERRLACLLCVLGLAGLLATGIAHGAEPVLPLGTDGHGVHLRLQHGRPRFGHRQLVLTFDDSAAALYQRIAGRRLAVSCVSFDRHPRLFGVSSSGTTELRPPRRRRPIALGFANQFDLCSFGVRHGRRTTDLTRIPLTPLGAVRLDERNTAVTLIAAVHALAQPERPSAATVAASFHGIVLADPAQAPPPDVLGVYSDGAEHVYAAQIDRSGKLLFVELDGGSTRSNVMQYLIRRDPLGGL